MTSPVPIGPLIFVRLFRVWATARAEGENPLPPMQAKIRLLAPAPELTVACASLFELVEAHLGRALIPECCCNPATSRDEQALLGVLRHAPAAGQPFTSPAVPHGLPGAIGWAAFAVRRALGASFGGELEAPEPARPAVCPFSQAPQSMEPNEPMRAAAVQ
jgi:hypothetical protein